MTKAYYRLGEANIVHGVMNPEKVYKNSFRKMPKLAVAPEEAKDLVAFLKWTAEIENRKWPPQNEKYVRAARAKEAQAREVPRTDLVLGSCGGESRQRHAPATNFPGEGRVDRGLRPRSPVREAHHDQV